jgi:hypothetical protein
LSSLLHPSAGGPPLKVTVEGKVLGNEIDIRIVWKPHFDLVEFIKEVFTALWEHIKAFVKAVI